MQENLVNKDLVRRWAYWTLVWLTLFPFGGVLVSIKFHNPEFLSSVPWLTFGRMRPVHINGVIFGVFTTGFFTLLYYYVPKLCGMRMYKEAWGFRLAWLWNLSLIAGTFSLLAGFNQGIEAGEFPLWIDVPVFLVFLMITIQVFGTIFRRKEPRLYVALWYTMAAFIWTDMNYALGNFILPYWITGVNSAALHGLYIHYIVGLWITPAGLALIYYFLPVSARNPLYSHKLSLIGFWTIAFFYPYLGIHHYLYSPILEWTQTVAIAYGMLLIIPVWTVTTNFIGTVKGRWDVMTGTRVTDYAAKFLVLGAVYYLLGCFQGSVEALRRMQQLTHFTDFVVAHSHMTIFGTFVLWVTGGLYYVWPRLTGRELWSPHLARWHFWLTVSGFTAMMLILMAAGFIQGSMLEHGVQFVDTVVTMKPWWVARSLSGFVMDIGMALFFYNLWKTAREGEPLSDAPPRPQPTSPVHAPMHSAGILERPSSIILGAGVFFFLMAIMIQWTLPLMIQSREMETVETVRGEIIHPSDYTPEEKRGRAVYIREGCWYCHSQYIRPVTGEDLRWGPVSQRGEYAYDVPHLFGTRRIGPDLTRIGRKYGDDWHFAHHWDPRTVVPDSVMPVFPWLYEGKEESGAPKPNEDGKALIAYLQKLGTQIADWREQFASISLVAGSSAAPSGKMASFGKRVYERRCVGCHGDKGDGKGPSAPFLNPKPRDFTKGIFKFHSSVGKDSLPLDTDLYRTITHGLAGTAMPMWHEISEKERWAVIQYIKTFSERWQKDQPGPSLIIPAETPDDGESIGRGKALFATSGCLGCHGPQGKGDGPLAPVLRDAFGNPVRPANFTLAVGMKGGVKLGHSPRHIFTTIMNGVGGTPMEAFAERLKPEEAWDLVHYVRSLREAARREEIEKAKRLPLPLTPSEPPPPQERIR